MDVLSRVRLSGPLAPFGDDFVAWLGGLGYMPASAAVHLRRMTRLSRWIEDRGVAVSGLNPAVVKAFLADRHAHGRYVAVRIGAYDQLLAFLRANGVIAPVGAGEPQSESAAAVVLARYAEYLAVEHGLTAGTIKRYLSLTRVFLSGLEHQGELDLDQVTAAVVTEFLVEWSGRNPRSASHMASALRSLLRFLHVDGVVASGLADAVPSVARRRLAGLPNALPPDEVAAMLASCDPATAVGRRDLAILTVLSRLGLRIGEVVALRLDDIDWRRGELVIHGKGNRHEALPLPADVGEALVSYLTDRPVTDAREVFLRARAPYRAMSRGAASNVAASAARRAGLGAPVYAHRLRHSAATAMLAGGASLDEIGQVLRHRHQLTTAIYAKVDLDGLRTIARPWPASGVSA